MAVQAQAPVIQKEGTSSSGFQKGIWQVSLLSIAALVMDYARYSTCRTNAALVEMLFKSLFLFRKLTTPDTIKTKAVFFNFVLLKENQSGNEAKRNSEDCAHELEQQGQFLHVDYM